VLQEAADNDVPLFERLKFLAIFSSNLDEFFRVRYPSVVALAQLNTKNIKQLKYNDAEQIADDIQAEITRQLSIFGEILRTLIEELRKNDIYFYYNQIIKEEHRNEIREIFLSQVLSFIQIVYLDSKSGATFLPENNRLYFVVTLKEPVTGILNHAVINIPSNKLRRFFVLTPIDDIEYVIFIDDIIRENLAHIFPGKEMIGVYSIKLNRDAEMHLVDEFSGNLLNKIDRLLQKRDFGPPSRFLYDNKMPSNLLQFLASLFSIEQEDMFAGGRYHHLSDLSAFPDFDKGLKYKKLKPLSHQKVLNSGDIFNLLATQDILLNIPYQSYNPVLSFFNQAAVDTEVTHIYITLYRVAAESHIVNALISAAKNGKKVTAFIELKARFDEANNIRWSKVMKQAGVKIIYSIPDIKVHSKIGLVRKKKGTKSAFYAILSTGNFNEITAQFYTDHVLMTTDKPIARELLQLFKFLQKKDKLLSKNNLKFNNLLVSQFNLNDELYRLIENEIEKAGKQQPALIRIKVNNLEEPKFINHIIKASEAGVEIRLIVRSVCCIIPAENITIKRIVDQYLEHTRLMMFGTGEKIKVIMGSADLMTRNLYHRIEVCVPVKNEALKQDLIEYFEIQWKDNDKAVRLTAAMQQEPVPQEGELVNAQQSIYTYLQAK
jgi:polyphosphate kinase